MPNTYTVKKGKSALIRRGPGLGTLKLRRISAKSQVVINKVKKLENGIRRGHMIKPVKGWVSMQCLKKSLKKGKEKKRDVKKGGTWGDDGRAAAPPFPIDAAFPEPTQNKDEEPSDLKEHVEFPRGRAAEARHGMDGSPTNLGNRADEAITLTSNQVGKLVEEHGNKQSGGKKRRGKTNKRLSKKSRRKK